MIFTEEEEARVCGQLKETAKTWYDGYDAWTTEELVACVATTLVFLREFDGHGVLMCLLHRAHDMKVRDYGIAVVFQRFITEVVRKALSVEREKVFWREWAHLQEIMRDVHEMRVKRGMDPTVEEDDADVRADF